MSDFSDRPFVAGSLIGLRAFDVDRMGRLGGVTHKTIFKPGENEATCRGDALSRSRANTLASLEEMSLRQRQRALGLQPPAVGKTEHQVGAKGCTCGFYAYFDGKNDYAKAGRVVAVIEGYGTCTIGSRGFRASKARLVAVVLPKAPRFFTTWKLSALLLVLFGVAATLAAIDGSWWRLGLNAGLAGVWSVSLGLRIRDRLKATPLHKVATSIRRNYPEVPTYPSVRAALRSHPLTPPQPAPLPTPDDDDFWTRAVPR